MSRDQKSSSYFIGGIAFCIVGSICFSAKAVFVKLAYRETSVDALTLLALRMLFSLPFFVISAWIISRKNDNVRFTNRQWLGVALVGCLGYYISSLLDFLGLQYVSAGIERLILFIYPTLVLLISVTIFKEKTRPMQWLAVIISYAGLIIAYFGETNLNDSNANFLVGVSLIFGCAITYAVYTVGSGKLISSIGSVKFNSYAMSFACLGVLLHFFIVRDSSLFKLPQQVYIYSFAMAIISTVIPTYLITAGIKRISSKNAAIVSSVGPVSTILLANLFLDEPILITQITGTIFILFGIFVIAKSSKI